MATIVPSIGLKGIEGYKVQVEVQLLPGVEGVQIVGLPDASVKESKDRVMGALYANDCEVPDKKIIINLSPAEHRKAQVPWSAPTSLSKILQWRFLPRKEIA